MSDKIDFHFVSNCCPISKFIQESRNQALNIGLDQSYINCLDNLLISILPYVLSHDVENVHKVYSDNYNNLITKRDEAFNSFMNNIKNICIPPELPVPQDLPQ